MKSFKDTPIIEALITVDEATEIVAQHLALRSTPGWSASPYVNPQLRGESGREYHIRFMHACARLALLSEVEQQAALAQAQEHSELLKD